MLPHSTVCCCRNSHWRRSVCGNDHKTKTQTSSQSSSLPCPCRPFGVSFTTPVIICNHISCELGHCMWTECWEYCILYLFNRFDQGGNFIITGASDSRMFVLSARPSKGFEIIGWFGNSQDDIQYYSILCLGSVRLFFLMNVYFYSKRML